MATTKEMRELNAEALEKRAGELRESLFNMRIKHRTGALGSSADLGKSRKELARVLTVLGEKQRAAAAQNKKS